MNDCSLTSKALLTAFALQLVCAIPSPPALAANSGLDTPTGVTSLPFSVQGVQIMTLYGNGLGIGRSTDGGWQLEVQGTGNQHGIYGQAGAANYWGVGGYSNDGNSYGGLGVANSYGVYAVSSNGNAVYGVSTGSNWSGVFGNYSGSPYGVLGQATNYGVFGQSPGGYGVYGANNNGNNWAGVFVGGYGVYGQSGGGWAGEFYTTGSQNGVWIGNPWNNAYLCLNGQCATSLSGRYGGLYVWSVIAGGGCVSGNPLNGGQCGCPGGASDQQLDCWNAGGGSHNDCLHMCTY